MGGALRAKRDLFPRRDVEAAGVCERMVGDDGRGRWWGDGRGGKRGRRGGGWRGQTDGGQERAVADLRKLQSGAPRHGDAGTKKEEVLADDGNEGQIPKNEGTHYISSSAVAVCNGGARSSNGLRGCGRCASVGAPDRTD
eukprot:CAMPEP_0174844836 /NCGR_PEP_ID=MMETSP1114-20130205/11356_1 /TAXON_ID=312471 /ORGANISM="Neobodo designis, Strain CCAP 1951/1" /LENGTH=139 /DNA_ID=CAMNT_0016079081 /DNA_START=143 /DNA_END=560 /DNA_ORIENTATION=+